ncbi:MAG: DUF86 domain-containing protein [Armatimonadetes bacterium]|nr:DUF86 domain-containing protein [Armatimonadota bacterium]
MRDERLYLVQIVEALRLVLEYAAVGAEAFYASQQVQDAIARRFEIVGEAAKRLSPEMRSGAPHIPWTELAGFRDVLIHQYDRVDASEMWRVVSTECEQLLEQVESYLVSLGVTVPDPRSAGGSAGLSGA